MGDGHLDMLIIDWHGGIRGKRLPMSMRDKILQGQCRIPISTQAMDIWGDDRDEITGLALSIGDPDGLCIPDENGDGFIPTPWNNGSEQILCSIFSEKNISSHYDVRQILQRTVDALNVDGLYPTVAVELEFYLFDNSTITTGEPRVPQELNVAGEPSDLQLYDMRALDRVEAVLETIRQYASEMGIPAETALAEFGPGQFEINLKHQSNPVRAADHAVLFKQIVDRASFKHGLLSSFMAKPYTEHGGSGQHVHISMSDAAGKNVFDTQGDRPDALLHAVNACITHMHESLLVFAPHANSYKRLQPDSFAPVQCNWGYDHRGVAVRLPEKTGAGARLEHRVAGADANPYLLLSTLLGSIHAGLKRAKLPDQKPVLPGDNSSAETLTHDWIRAIDNFDQSELLRSILGDEFCNTYVAIKRHEAATYNRQVSNIDLATYLTRV